jgi:signal transduction histidine kinase
MNSRSSFILAIGFGILVVLIAALGFGAIRRADSIYAEVQRAQDSYLQTDAIRRGIVTDLYVADILVRDYLLDPSSENVQSFRQELLNTRDSLQQRLDHFSELIGESDSARLARLQEEVQGYWDSLDPIFEWTPQEKSAQASTFLRHKVLPRRQAVMNLAREMARIYDENLSRARQRMQGSQQVLHSFLLRMTAFTLGLGIVVAALTIYRVALLERKHDEQRKQIEETQNNLRRLSRRLVKAQELERQALSRELHDEVGQMMTALGMELGHLEKLRNGNPDSLRSRIEEAKRLNADAMRAIRDLAMGLRPSMLDDIGIEAALQWQGREFSRHTGVPATVRVDGSLDHLSDSQRTCIYRVVQEALTNCARHAKAKHVLVSLRADEDGVSVMVKDDGVGFNPAAARGGLGLLGMQERVQELDGTVSIKSQRSGGTTIRVELPAGVLA